MVYFRFQDFVGSITVAPTPSHRIFPTTFFRMKVLHFNVLTSCRPKDELHQWFVRLYGEHIIPAIVHSYTKVLQRPGLVTVDKDGNSHPLLSNEALARFFKRLADRLQPSGSGVRHVHCNHYPGI